jgi:hypothetical protein
VLVNEKRGIVWLTPPRTGARSLEEGLAPHGFRRVGARHSPHPTCKPDRNPLDYGSRVLVTVRNHHCTVASWFGFCLLCDRRPQVPRTFPFWLKTFLQGESGAEPYVDHEVGALFENWTRHATEPPVRLECLGHLVEERLGHPVSLPRIRDDHGLSPYEQLFTPQTFATVETYFRHEIAWLARWK